MKRGGAVRLQHFVSASAGVAMVIFLDSGEAAQQGAASARPPAKYRNLEQMFYSEIRPATPDQQLSQTLEKKSDAEAAYIQGMIREDEGDYEEALATYTRSLQLDPGGNPQLAVRIAHEYAKRGEVATGIDILKDLAKVRPNEPAAYLNLAYFYLRQLKKPELAVKYAEQAVKVAPDNFVGYQTVFEVYLALKRKPDAEAVLERAQKLNSKDPGFWLSLTDLSIRLYRSENGNFPPNKISAVEPLLQKAVSLAGDDGSVYSKAADNYVLMNQVSSAIPLYVRALELNRGNTEDRYKLAQSFLKTGQRDEAIRTLEEMVKANPLKFEIYEFLARLYEDSGKIDRALASYQQALLLAPNQPENYLHTAETQLQLKKFDDAIGTLQDARRRFPIPQITYSLAIALSTAKRHNDALPVYEAALQEARSTQEDLIDATFYFNYAVSAEQAGFVDKAASLLRKSIELDPSKAAQAYNYLGFMWVDRNMNLDEAGSFIKKALELDPDNGAYIDSLGWYYYRKTEFGKALTELLHAADVLKPEDPVVFEHIGDTYQAVGNTAQALVYWQKAANLDPQNSALATKIDQSKAKLTANPTTSPGHMPGPQPSSSPESAPPPKTSATP
jgi:tetratricopeptide (TPR) repeat protein